MVRALHHHATAVIFSHNHPSGHSEPSRSDIHITKKLTDILEIVDVKVLDHIIVGDDNQISLANKGLI